MLFPGAFPGVVLVISLVVLSIFMYACHVFLSGVVYSCVLCHILFVRCLFFHLSFVLLYELNTKDDNGETMERTRRPFSAAKTANFTRSSRVIRKHYEAHDEAQKKRVQKGARGAAQQPKRVALHRRRLHARKQTVLGRKNSKLHAVFACDSETL